MKTFTVLMVFTVTFLMGEDSTPAPTVTPDAHAEWKKAVEESNRLIESNKTRHIYKSPIMVIPSNESLTKNNNQQSQEVDRFKEAYGFDSDTLPTTINNFIESDGMPSDFIGSYFKVFILNDMKKITSNTSKLSIGNTTATYHDVKINDDGERTETPKTVRIGRLFIGKQQGLTILYMPDFKPDLNSQTGLILVSNGKGNVFRLFGVLPDGSLRSRVNCAFDVLK